MKAVLIFSVECSMVNNSRAVESVWRISVMCLPTGVLWCFITSLENAMRVIFLKLSVFVCASATLSSTVSNTK